jgi:hypothetical protein
MVSQNIGADRPGLALFENPSIEVRDLQGQTAGGVGAASRSNAVDQMIPDAILPPMQQTTDTQRVPDALGVHA